MVPEGKTKIQSKLYLRILGTLAILLTLIPFIPADNWSVRIFDFPHLQLTFFTLLVLTAYFIKFDIRKWSDYVFASVLLLCFFFQVTKIIPYTPISRYEVKPASTSVLGDTVRDRLSIYTANVQQSNTKDEPVLNDAKSFDADVLLFTETNADWISILVDGLGTEYAHRIEVPMENTYGMLLFSKHKLEESLTRFLVEDTIPSIDIRLVLPSGEKIRLFALHPAPPTPAHNPSSVDRDAELIKIGQMAKNSKIPVVVMGDFNDVAWSETTRLFQSYSGLLDLRKGRGLYNTYNAKYWFVRWPLDHVFVSPHFRIIDIELGREIGSDHFPFYTALSLEPASVPAQELSAPDASTIERANEQLKEEERNDKEQIP